MKKLLAVMLVAGLAVAFAQEQDGGKFPPTPGPTGEGMFGYSAAANNGVGGGQHDGGKFPPTPGPNGRHNRAAVADGGELDGGKFPPTPGPTGEGMFG